MQNNQSLTPQDSSLRDSLICEYQLYVRNLAGMMISTMELPQHLLDDLVAGGLLGLVEAAERFDLAQGNNFKAFAFHRIRGAMIDSIRRTSDFSGKSYRAARTLEAYASLREEYASSHNRVDRNDKKRRIEEILQLAADGALAYRLSFTEEDGSLPLDPHGAKNAEQIIINDEEHKKLSALVETLPEKERLIIEEYYINGLSFVQITEKYPNLSKSWVSRLHKRALRMLGIRMRESS